MLLQYVDLDQSCKECQETIDLKEQQLRQLRKIILNSEKLAKSKTKEVNLIENNLAKIERKTYLLNSTITKLQSRLRGLVSYIIRCIILPAA